jgi:Flp pilus assembly protein protease CpaA
MVNIKEMYKSAWPYAGLPVIAAALLVVRAGRTETLLLLWYVLVIVFGYVAAILDIKTKRIPNMLVLTMLAAWVLTMTPQMYLDTAAALALLLESALGFAIGGGLFLLVYLISRKGLGGGDVKFMAAAGLYLGFSGTIPVMLYGTVLAALFGYC